MRRIPCPPGERANRGLELVTRDVLARKALSLLVARGADPFELCEAIGGPDAAPRRTSSDREAKDAAASARTLRAAIAVAQRLGAVTSAADLEYLAKDLEQSAAKPDRRRRLDVYSRTDRVLDHVLASTRRPFYRLVANLLNADGGERTAESVKVHAQRRAGAQRRPTGRPVALVDEYARIPWRQRNHFSCDERLVEAERAYRAFRAGLYNALDARGEFDAAGRDFRLRILGFRGRTLSGGIVGFVAMPPNDPWVEYAEVEFDVDRDVADAIAWRGEVALQARIDAVPDDAERTHLWTLSR